MIKIIEAALSIIDKLIPTEDKRKAKAKLKEDLELQEAIRSGDMRKVEEIRQRKKNYSELLLIFICLGFVCLFSGCNTTQQPPILGDQIPVKLKVGQPVIKESGETITVESNKNTLVSDAYIYSSVTALDEKKK